MSAPSAKVLADARELIERGWCQGMVRDGQLYCAIGAIRKAATGNAYQASDETRALRLLMEKFTGGESLPTWNDNPLRTHGEVVEAFKRAEALARGEVTHTPIGDER
jgi:hypothetical protein